MANPQKQLMIKSLPPFPIEDKIVLGELNLNEILKALERQLPRHTNEKIQLKMKFASEYLPVAADKAQMEKALANLVQNAAEAMPDGGILTLGTGLATSQDRPPHQRGGNVPGTAFISVADTGVGMDRSIKHKIFEPYFTTKQGSHKGLGLPIAHSIITKHNGCVKVESTPGKGTVIKVYLPLVKGMRTRVPEDPNVAMNSMHLGSA